MSALARPDRSATLLDLLDRVLDKGIVIDYDVTVSVAGLRVIDITGRTVVASIERYMDVWGPQHLEGTDAGVV